mmetsp:Transcript_8944/g.25985  ORF Transcript_8944/g.25985 Transcript_8944/m.25985 type:complete len:423 (-) Transcript_8944:209-1477(-)
MESLAGALRGRRVPRLDDAAHGLLGRAELLEQLALAPLDVAVERVEHALEVGDLGHLRGPHEERLLGVAQELIHGRLGAEPRRRDLLVLLIRGGDHHRRLVGVLLLEDVERLQMAQHVLAHLEQPVDLLGLHADGRRVDLAGEEVVEVAEEHARRAQALGQVLHEDGVARLLVAAFEAVGDEVVAQLHEVLVLLREAEVREEEEDPGQDRAGPEAMRALLEVADGYAVEGLVEVHLGRLVDRDQQDGAHERREGRRDGLELEVAQHHIGVEADVAQQLLVSVDEAQRRHPAEEVGRPLRADWDVELGVLFACALLGDVGAVVDRRVAALVLPRELPDEEEDEADDERDLERREHLDPAARLPRGLVVVVLLEASAEHARQVRRHVRQHGGHGGGGGVLQRLPLTLLAAAEASSSAARGARKQ